MKTLAFMMGVIWATLAAAEPTRLYQLAGEMKTIGSWALKLQDDAAVMVMGVNASIAHFPETLEKIAGQANLQMTCSEGLISVSAIIPKAAKLKAGAHNGELGSLIFWIDDQLTGEYRIKDGEFHVEGDGVHIPISQGRTLSEGLNAIIGAKDLTVRISAVDLTRVTASFKMTKTREAFQHLADRCGL